MAVAVALAPATYDFGAEPPDGGDGWVILDELYPTNPRLLLSESDVQMVRLWRLYRGGSFTVATMGGVVQASSGVGHLPDPGGSLDQPAIMLEAFDFMSRIADRLRPEGRS